MKCPISNTLFVLGHSRPVLSDSLEDTWRAFTEADSHVEEL
jgi:hypothetical protein